MLLIASLYKQFHFHRRYLFNTIFSLILFTVIFIALFFGYSAIAPTSVTYGDSVSGLVISYYAWSLMMSVYTFTGYVVEENKSNGTLENIMVNSQNITAVLIFECLASIFFNFIFSWIIIGLLAWICAIQLYIHVFTVLFILFIGLISVLGLSLIVAGFAMMYRKMDSIMSLIQFALLGGLFLSDNTLTRLLIPFHFANTLLKRSFLEDASLLQFAGVDYLLLFLNSSIFIFAGLLFFTVGLNFARRKGTLSYY